MVHPYRYSQFQYITIPADVKQIYYRKNPKNLNNQQNFQKTNSSVAFLVYQ